MADLFGLIPVQRELPNYIIYTYIHMSAVAVMEVMWWSLVQRLPMDCGLKQKLGTAPLGESWKQSIPCCYRNLGVKWLIDN